MNKAVIIRQYKPDDFVACRELWVQLTEWHKTIYQSPGIGGSDPGSHFDEHLNHVGPGNIWVAELDSKVMGMAGLIPGQGEAELEPLVISEAYRGQGIGALLTQAVVSAARSQGVHILIVRPVARNTTAVQFFHKMGFDILGHIELNLDLGAADRQVWKLGERIAGLDFRF